MKSVQEILDTNDFEEAKSRYEACQSNRWKGEWWDVILKIWKATTKWAKMYILDPIKKTIKRFLTNDEREHFCYWIRLLREDGTMFFNKIGTAFDPISRWDNILNEAYCRVNKITKYEVMRVWNCGNNAGEGLESYFRAMCIREYGSKAFIRNDRFLCELEADKMDKWASEYLGA